MTILYLIIAVIAYLLGSIPFGYILVKFLRGEDIRRSGSGNIGATNVVRSGAKGLGALTLMLDAFKGLVAVWIGSVLAVSTLNRCSGASDLLGSLCIPPLRLMSVAAVFAVLGHIFPLWLKFKGGKGVATALGVFTLLFPKAVLISLVIFIVVLALTRYVSLGSILAAISFPMAAYLLYPPDWVAVVLAAAVSCLVVLKHLQNIRRLLAGRENRFGGSKKSAEREA